MKQTLTEKQLIVQRSVRDFCDREIRPLARELDNEARFPWDIVQKMGKLGYFGIQVPRQLGGADMDSISYCLTIEEISKASAGLGLCLAVHNGVCVYPLLTFGSEEQKQKWAPPLAKGEKIGAFCAAEPNAGSNFGGIESTAILEKNHYTVNANKVFVTNGGVADICLIFVKTDPAAGYKGISVIVAERGTQGFEVGETEDLCGMRANQVSSIRLSDSLIPIGNILGGEGQGMKIGLATLDTGRIGIAAQALGIAQAALDEGVRYAQQRYQFGVPIGRHQAIGAMLADMDTQVEASRLMVYRAADLKDKGRPFTRESAMAKLIASETASRVTDMAVQIHGGYGYSKSYPVERYYRDARVTRIYEGTSEILRMVISRSVLSGK
jgi:butyryl-CoA dehydrogenase